MADDARPFAVRYDEYALLKALVARELNPPPPEPVPEPLTPHRLLAHLVRCVIPFVSAKHGLPERIVTLAFWNELTTLIHLDRGDAVAAHEAHRQLQQLEAEVGAAPVLQLALLDSLTEDASHV